MKNIDQILANVKSLPMLPDVVLRVIKLSNDPNTPVDAIIETMKLDQGLTANLLRLCNSSYYGLSRNITSLREAVVYLGAKSITDLMMAGFCSEFFARPVEAYKLDQGQLWRHAVAVAVSTQAVAQRAKKAEGRQRSLEYTAGLLHDIGKIILSETCADEFNAILVAVEERRIPFEQAEHEIIGMSHSEVGGEIARRWKLPPAIIDCITHHHSPDQADTDPWLVACVHIGNLLAVTMGLGIGVDGLAARFDKSAMDTLKLDMPAIMELTVEALDQFNRSIDILKM